MKELVSPITGTRKSQTAAQTKKTGKGSERVDKSHKPMPLTRAHRLMQRSIASQRSAIWPQINGASREPIAPVEDAQAVASAEKPRFFKYNEKTGTHAPMMANARKICTARRTRKNRAGGEEIAAGDDFVSAGVMKVVRDIWIPRHTS